MNKKAEKTTEKTFEECMSELETIVLELESGKRPLSEMLSLYERGTDLGKKCEAMLSSFEGRLNMLEEANDL